MHNGAFNRDLVSDEFNDMCTSYRVEATVQAHPNPGNPFKAMRVITFRNFNLTTIRVIQFDNRNQVHLIPAKGTVQVMLMPDEPLPKIERMEE